jgi:hypothetical protein
MKTIIAGSRHITSYHLPPPDQWSQRPTEVVCGEARGADRVGKAWAIEHGIPVKSFPADWDKHGKRAGILRNEEMGRYADRLIAIWDGKSRGTKHMIDFMQSLGKLVKVVIIKYEQHNS